VQGTPKESAEENAEQRRELTKLVWEGEAGQHNCGLSSCPYPPIA
jgi:hypothetical protein